MSSTTAKTGRRRDASSSATSPVYTVSSSSSSSSSSDDDEDVREITPVWTTVQPQRAVKLLDAPPGFNSSAQANPQGRQGTTAKRRRTISRRDDAVPFVESGLNTHISESEPRDGTCGSETSDSSSSSTSDTNRLRTDSTDEDRRRSRPRGRLRRPGRASPSPLISPTGRKRSRRKLLKSETSDQSVVDIMSSAGSSSSSSEASQGDASSSESRSSSSVEGGAPEEMWIVPARYLEKGSTSTSFDADEAKEDGSRASDEDLELADDEEDLMAISSKSSWLFLGGDHPDKMAESQPLAGLIPPVPDEDLVIHIPEMLCTEMGRLSSLQMECVVQAARCYRQRIGSGEVQGYLLGDGTGCGKGRVISASIFDMWNKGYRRHLWISVSADLLADAMRDLQDVGAGHIPVLNAKSLKVVDLDSPRGVDDCCLNAEKLGFDWCGEGIIFATYSLIGRGLRRLCCFLNKMKSLKASQLDANATIEEILQWPVENRIMQIIRWLAAKPSYASKGVDSRYEYTRKWPKKMRKVYRFIPDTVHVGGLIVFDEAHKAKNLMGTDSGKTTSVGSSMTGQVVRAVQQALHFYSVMYASATGASEIRNLAYLTRLGLWGANTPFATFKDFSSKLESGGVAALECLAMDMKSRGIYSCRTLSFDNVRFFTFKVKSSPQFIEMYNQVARILRSIYNFMEGEFVRTTDGISGTSSTGVWDSVTPSSVNTRQGRRPSNMFWGLVQRVFKQLLVCQKVERAVEVAQAEVQKGRQVVLSLWSTGEARLSHHMANREDDSELEDFVSCPKLMLEHFVNEKLAAEVVDLGSDNLAREHFEEIKNAVEDLTLPINPLDDLVERLGGPSKVAELSGRSNRLISDRGKIRYVPRDAGCSVPSKLSKASLNSTNIQEQELFQSGRKKYAIITEAASAGISLHSDRGMKKPAPRVMICLELPWAADKAIQQFGRVHRSNQVAAPTYYVMVSDIGGESRFYSSVARRLKVLGAITRGDRRAALGTSTRAKTDDTKGKVDLTDDVVVIEEVETQQSRDLPLLDFDVSSKWGLQALSTVFKWLVGTIQRCPSKLLPKLEFKIESVHAGSYPSDLAFATAMTEALAQAGLGELLRRWEEGVKRTKLVDRFLNRILLMMVKEQNEMFEFYCKVYDQFIANARDSGELDRGVENLNSSHGTAYKLSVAEEEDLFVDDRNGLKTRYLRVECDRGMSYEQAMEILSRRKRRRVEGFYWYYLKNSDRKLCTLVLLHRLYIAASTSSSRVIIYRPNIGATAVVGGQPATLDLLKTWGFVAAKKSSEEEIRESWIEQYNQSLTDCMHVMAGWKCSTEGCTFGKRVQMEHIIAGNIIFLWHHLEEWLQTSDVDDNKRSRRLRLVKGAAVDGRNIVGVQVPRHRVDIIRQRLKEQTMGTSRDASSNVNAKAAVCSPQMMAKLVNIIASTQKPQFTSNDAFLSIINAAEDPHSNFLTPVEASIVTTAFPFTPKSLSHFDSLLQHLAFCDIGITRAHGDACGGSGVYSFNRTVWEAACQSGIYSTMLTHMTRKLWSSWRRPNLQTGIVEDHGSTFAHTDREIPPVPIDLTDISDNEHEEEVQGIKATATPLDILCIDEEGTTPTQKYRLPQFKHEHNSELPEQATIEMQNLSGVQQSAAHFMEHATTYQNGTSIISTLEVVDVDSD